MSRRRTTSTTLISQQLDIPSVFLSWIPSDQRAATPNKPNDDSQLPDAEVEYLDFSNGEPIPKKRRTASGSGAATTSTETGGQRVEFLRPVERDPPYNLAPSPSLASQSYRHVLTGQENLGSTKTPFLDYTQPLFNSAASRRGDMVQAHTPESFVHARFTLAKNLASPEGFKEVAASSDPLVQLLHPIITKWDIAPSDHNCNGYVSASVKARIAKDFKKYNPCVREIPVCLDSFVSASDFLSDMEDQVHDLMEAQPPENLQTLPHGYLNSTKTRLKTLRRLVETRWTNGHGGYQAQSPELWLILSLYIMKALYFYCCSGFSKYFTEWIPALWDHAVSICHKPICTVCFTIGHTADKCYQLLKATAKGGLNKGGGGYKGSKWGNHHNTNNTYHGGGRRRRGGGAGGGGGRNDYYHRASQDFPTGSAQQGGGTGPYHKHQRPPPHHHHQGYKGQQPAKQQPTAASHGNGNNDHTNTPAHL